MANFFPRWTNWIPLKLVICGIIAVCGLTAATWYYATPKYTKIGYEPIQPVPFPHDVHVSQLGMDCRYCQLCGNGGPVECAEHPDVHELPSGAKDNPKLEPVRAELENGNPVEWCGSSHRRLRLLQSRGRT
jgi:hypothetical protein